MLRIWMLLLNVACLQEANVSQEASGGSDYTLHLSEGQVEKHEVNSRFEATLTAAQLQEREGFGSAVQIERGSARHDKSPLQFAELRFSFTQRDTAYTCTLHNTLLQREIAFSMSACREITAIKTQTHDQNTASSSINLTIKLTNLAIVNTFEMRLLQGWKKTAAEQEVRLTGIKTVYGAGTDCEQEVWVDSLAKSKMTEKRISYTVLDKGIRIQLNKQKKLADVDCDTSRVIFTAHANDKKKVVVHVVGIEKDGSGGDYIIGISFDKIRMFATPVRFKVVKAETTP